MLPAGGPGPLCSAAEGARHPIQIVGVLGHAAGDDVVERGGNARIRGARSRGRQGDVGRHQLLEIVTGKRRVAGQQLIEHARQRIDIDGGCGYLSANPFGRHIIQGADLGAGRRKPGVALGLGDSEVDQIYKVGGGDDDALRLDVAMDQSFGISSASRAAATLLTIFSRARVPAGPPRSGAEVSVPAATNMWIYRLPSDAPRRSRCR